MFILSPVMSLPVPIVGTTEGPEYASDLNSCFAVIDGHDHSPGSGNQITPDGLNINGDLPLNQNNLSLVRSTRYTPQGAVLSGALDTGCVYVNGVDLYYNDVSGNKIRITQSGGIAGSPGSISNLTSPASAAYSASLSTFVWQSGANIPASLDAGSVIVRKVSAGSNGITIAAPNSLASDYVLTLPLSPAASTKIVTMDSTGALSPAYDVDNATIEIASSSLRVKDGGITSAKIGAGEVKTANIGAQQVTNTEIANATIDGSTKLVDGSVPPGKLTNPTRGISSGTGTPGNGLGVYNTIATASVFSPNTGRPVLVTVHMASPLDQLVVPTSCAYEMTVLNGAGSGFAHSVTFPQGAWPFSLTFVSQASQTGGSEVFSFRVSNYTGGGIPAPISIGMEVVQL